MSKFQIDFDIKYMTKYIYETFIDGIIFFFYRNILGIIFISF